MNSDLKEYSRVTCKRNNTVNISDIVHSRHKKTFKKANLFGKKPGGRAEDSREMVIWKDTAAQLNTVNISDIVHSGHKRPSKCKFT